MKDGMLKVDKCLARETELTYQIISGPKGRVYKHKLGIVVKRNKEHICFLDKEPRISDFSSTLELI